MLWKLKVNYYIAVQTTVLINFYVFIYLFLFELFYFCAASIGYELTNDRYWLTGCCILLASPLAVLWHLDSFTTGTLHTAVWHCVCISTCSSTCLRTSLVSVLRPLLKGWQTLLSVVINGRWYAEVWKQNWNFVSKMAAYSVVQWAGWITQSSLPLQSTLSKTFSLRVKFIYSR